MPQYSVFLSYSHDDLEVVSGLTPLLQIQRRDLIFLDKTVLKPGQKWEEVLLNALDESKAIVVFWCHHSSCSAYVRKEFERAYAQQKEIIPVILDDTPVDKPLSEFQWIDLRYLIKHETGRSDATISSRTNKEIHDFTSENSAEKADQKKEPDLIQRGELNVQPPRSPAYYPESTEMPASPFHSYAAEKILEKLNEKLPPENSY